MINTENNEAICPYAFTSVVIRNDKKQSPCCFAKPDYSLNNHSIQDFFLSDQMTSLRSDMIAGKKNSYCNGCYVQEEASGTSPRTEALAAINITDADLNIEFPRRIEFHVSNLCNLKCLMCVPQDSSMLLAEDRLIGKSTPRQSDCQYTSERLGEIFASVVEQDIEVLDLRGGETLIVPEIQQLLIDADPDWCSEIHLRIQTNGTVFPEKWQEIFSKFNSVDIMISIDGVGPVNEYIRFPSKWNDIDSNIDTFKTIDNLNAITLNCTVTNLNFCRIIEVVEYANKKQLNCHFAKLFTPRIYTWNNLPPEIYAGAVNKIELVKDLHPGLKQFLDQKYFFNRGLWDEFCKEIKLRDNIRKRNILKVLPEFEYGWVTY